MFRQNTVFTREIRLVYGDVADQAIVLANSLTKRGDVLDLKQLEAVLLEHMEMLQNMRESIQEQQFQDILEFGVELQQESRIWRGITISIARHPTAA
jgi:hypothetical protein